MVSATDGSAFTGSVTVYVTGAGGTQAIGSVGSGACTHEGNGFHTYLPSQAETNYDHIAFTFIGTGAVPATVQVFTGYPQTGDNYARLGSPAGASISADIAAVKSDTFEILVDTGTTLANKIDAIDDFVDDLESRLGVPANLGSGATIAANLADIESQTDDIGALGAGLSNIPWNAAWDTQVQSEVEDAIIVYRLDELLAADSDIDGAAPPTVGSVFHELMTKTTGSFTYDQTTDSLEAIRDFDTTIKSETATIVADTNELQTDWANGGRLDNILDARASQTSVDTKASQTSVDDLPTNSELATALASADDAVLAELAVVESYIDDISGVVWDTVLEGSYTAKELNRIYTAALAGKVNGAETTTVNFRDTGDSKNVIHATVDTDGNRSAVTLNVT